MEKKYKLIETKFGFYRIKALKDFQLITGEVIKTGDLGGFVENKHNLSQEGNCWIDYYAKTIGKSRVKDNAVLKDYSVVFDNSTVSGNAVMNGESKAFGNSTVSGNAIMNYHSEARDNSTISGNAVMKDCSCAEGDSIITGNALLQACQHIRYGAVTTDLLGTKDWVGALYAELGITSRNNNAVLYKKVWSADNPDVFKSGYNRNFLYKIGKISRVQNVDEDVFESYTSGLHFTSLEFINDFNGDTTIECEVKVPDIVTVQDGKVRARKCKVLRVCT